MRCALALLLAAAIGSAEDPADLERRVEALVQELGSPLTELRSLARYRLAAYGEKIKPLLERVESDDPEVRRAIRYLLRSRGREMIEIVPPTAPAVQIGAPLVLDVRIINNSEQNLMLLPGEARRACPFRLRVGNKDLPALRFEEVNWGDDPNVMILAGATRRFRLTIEGNLSPLRRPALHEVSVVFDGEVARGYATTSEDSLDPGRLKLESAPVQIHVLGRRAEELEKALASDDAKQREAAALELGLREDDAVVPILRRHARERPVRLAAARRLGVLGDPEDYAFLLDSTRDESVDVRRAAVLGLGKYPKARPKLLRIAIDSPEIREEAIRALRGLKHLSTIECYLALLEQGGLTDNGMNQIRGALLEWTGMSVDTTRRSEILAFKGWWEANREQWVKKNAAGK